MFELYNLIMMGVQQQDDGTATFTKLLCSFRSLHNTPDRQQSKTLILSMKVDQKSSEMSFLIAICRPKAIEKAVSSDF